MRWVNSYLKGEDINHFSMTKKGNSPSGLIRLICMNILEL
jgi:hypothetical protein